MLDFILILTFLYFLIAGFYYGFVAGTIRFIGVVLGFYLSLVFFKPVANILSKVLYINETVAEFTAIFSIFTAIFIITLVFKFIVKDKVDENAKLKVIDRLVGGFVGLVLYVFLIFALVKYSQEYTILDNITSQSKIISFLREISQNK